MIENTTNHTDHFETSGTMMPASKYSIEKILKAIDFVNTKCIVELGLGDGCITRELLQAMSSNAVLYGFEINEHFVSICSKIDDERFVLFNTSAELLKESLKEVTSVDLILSTLPFTMMNAEMVETILSQCSQLIGSKGRFIQAVHNPLIYFKLKKYFDIIEVKFELRNFPPYIFFICKSKQIN